MIGRGDTVSEDRRISYEEQKLAKDDDVPFVKLAYPRNGIWSGKNQLGVEIPYNVSFDPSLPQTVFKMDEWGFPEVWTVSLGTRFAVSAGNVDIPAGHAFDAVAHVSFGSGGIVQTFDCDWVDGTAFALPMNALNVTATLNPLQILAGTPAPDNVKISVLIAKSGLSRSRATNTQYFNIPATQTLVRGPIPVFSKSVQLLPLNDAQNGVIYAAGFFIQFYPNISGAPVLSSVEGSHITPGTKIPIPALARYWGIHAPAGSAAEGAAIFNLFDE